jgi:hypothetical protein
MIIVEKRNEPNIIKGISNQNKKSNHHTQNVKITKSKIIKQKSKNESKNKKLSKSKNQKSK